MSLLESMPIDVFLAIGNACPRPSLNALAKTNHTCYNILNALLYSRNINQPYPEDSCIFYAIVNDNFDILKRAVAYGADLNIDTSKSPKELDEVIRAHDGCAGQIRSFSTPLLFAVKHQRLEIVRWMLDQGVNMDVSCQGYCTCYSDCPGIFPLHLAIRHPNNENMAKLLIERGARNSGRGIPALFDAIGLLDTEIFEILASQSDVDLRIKDNSNRSLLHIAIQCRIREVVNVCRRLVDAGVPVNEPDNAGCTPFRNIAKFDGYIEVAKLLLRHGADPTIRPNQPGPSHLLHQCLSDIIYFQRREDKKILEREQENRRELIEMMLQGGVHPEEGQGYSRGGACEGKALFLAAATIKNIECMKLLLKYGGSTSSFVNFRGERTYLVAGIIRSEGFDFETFYPESVPEGDDLNDRIKLLLENDAPIGPCKTAHPILREGPSALEIALEIALTNQPGLVISYDYQGSGVQPSTPSPSISYLEILCEYSTHKNVEESYVDELLKRCEDMRAEAIAVEDHDKDKCVDEVIVLLVALKERVASSGA